MRVVYRGNQVRFQISFKDGGVPLVPKNANYPSYSISDTNGAEVQSGIGLSLGDGLYQVEYDVPRDVEVSNEGGNWEITWVLLDENNRQYTLKENFEVKDDVLIEEAGREQKFIALANKKYLAKLALPTQPFSISLSFLQIGNDTPLVDVSENGLTHRSAGSLHSYEVEIAADIMVAGVDYVMLWEITDTAVSTPRYLPQTVMAINLQLYTMVQSVRMLIDKLQKRVGTPQGYEDSDIVEYLRNGASFINSVHPATGWCLYSNSPLYLEVFASFWVIAAAWYGLQAQYLLENDLAFNFNGLTTTLDMDRTNGIDTAIGRFREHIKEDLPPLKMKVFRLVNGNGHVGVRVFGYRNVYENFSYKLGSSKGGWIQDYIQRTGIFIP